MCLSLISCAGAARAQDASIPSDETAPIAQGASPLAAFEGRLIREVRLVGLERVSAQLVRNTLRTIEGRPVALDTISQDIRNLHRLGEFRRIQASAELYEDGSVAVIYEFGEAPILEDIEVVGNLEVASDDIAKAAAGAQLTAGTPIDDFRVDQAARAVEEMYKRKGYFAVEVTIDREELEETGVVTLRGARGSAGAGGADRLRRERLDRGQAFAS